jgi:hypothetical protein
LPFLIDLLTCNPRNIDRYHGGTSSTLYAFGEIVNRISKFVNGAEKNYNMSFLTQTEHNVEEKLWKINSNFLPILNAKL